MLDLDAGKVMKSIHAAATAQAQSGVLQFYLHYTTMAEVYGVCALESSSWEIDSDMPTYRPL